MEKAASIMSEKDQKTISDMKNATNEFNDLLINFNAKSGLMLPLITFENNGTPDEQKLDNIYSRLKTYYQKIPHGYLRAAAYSLHWAAAYFDRCDAVFERKAALQVPRDSITGFPQWNTITRKGDGTYNSDPAEQLKEVKKQLNYARDELAKR
jgi:hypothetical protein